MNEIQPSPASPDTGILVSTQWDMIPDQLPDKPPSLSLDKLRSILNWTGCVILLVGVVSAAWIWREQDLLDRQNEATQAAGSATPLAPLDSRKHVRDVEMYYGPLGVVVEKAEGLLHGKPLAKTIAVVSAATAAALFLFAARLRSDAKEE